MCAAASSVRFTNIVSISNGVKVISSTNDSVVVTGVDDVGVPVVDNDRTVPVVAVVMVIVEVAKIEAETIVVDPFFCAVDATDDVNCEIDVVGDVKLVVTL